jgi:5-methyltetrahydrofolate--homocysteine methyltransferase
MKKMNYLNHFPSEPMKNSLLKHIKNRILVLDGAMGTMIQQYKLTEEDYRGSLFANHLSPLKGNNDLLVLTKPDVIREIHEKYLEAGADIIETNTFNAQQVSLSDYGMEYKAYEINKVAAQIAKTAAQKFITQNPDRPRFVAGSIGPTNKTASLSPDANNPGFRNVTYDDLVKAYSEQIEGLIDGGVDLLLIETIFDTLNAKAALYATQEVFNERKIQLPVMVSVTVSDASGRTLSGQTLEAFLISVCHFPVFSIGLNCAFGAKQIEPYLEEISKLANCYVSIYPNAGLPNQFGGYDESAEDMAKIIGTFAKKGWVNIVGGCCGTTPEHIRAFSKELQHYTPRIVPVFSPVTRLSGLEPLHITKETNFINIGERTNVAGSKKFADLIKAKKYEEALSVARQQIENGAQIIDVNLDEGMIDAETEMPLFLNWLTSDPDVSKVPVMIDSSKWTVIENGLKCLQGKAIVNSISLKEGEEIFKERANKIKQFGAAAIVMAFDEEGQATTFKKKIEVCKRAYTILTEQLYFNPADIIFDPNILTIGTGIKEHNAFAIDYINTCRWIKENLPYAKISGGISNLSFAFRGNDAIRQVLHSVFLYHAIQAGLDMGIVNAGALPVYDDLDPKIRELAEDLILNRRPDATERILEAAINLKNTPENESTKDSWRNLPIKERIPLSLVKGISDNISKDIEEALKIYPSPLAIIEGPLMSGMGQVGELFGTGKMFLPQVMKSARVMKKAVEILQPLLLKNNTKGQVSTKAGKILFATIKGDVHDIGKNIAGIIMACNNYEVIDLGIMIPRETILDAAIKNNVDIVGLSGLITPSLDEMISVAQGMEERGLKIPLLIGGATTSKIHTAVKIAPVYSGPVIHIKDASQCAGVVSELLHSSKKESFIKSVQKEYEQIRADHEQRINRKKSISLEEAYKNRFRFDVTKAKISEPKQRGIQIIKDFPVEDLIPLINWAYFFHEWKFKGTYPVLLNDAEKGPEAKKLLTDAEAMLRNICNKKMIVANAIVGIFPAKSDMNNIHINTDHHSEIIAFQRNTEIKENNEPNLCLSDFIAPAEYNVQDYIGLFALTSGFEVEKWENDFKKSGDDYSAIMLRILADRLAEAFAEVLHQKVRKEIWGYSPNENYTVEELFAGKYQGIRPAPGYPACPDHTLKKQIFNILDAEKNTGIKLTETFSMIPFASVCGFYFAHPESRYFGISLEK